MTLRSLVTSSGTPNASAPAARSFSTAVSRRDSSRAPTPTRYPRAPSPLAIAYPIPLFAPVTSAVLVSFMRLMFARGPGPHPTPIRCRVIPGRYHRAYAVRVDTLETRELRYFMAVAEELHFGRAAERLGMAQPPLSRAIQQLERRLGVSLLERNRRGVSLTDAGEVLLHEGRAALDATAAAARRTRRAGGADSQGRPRNRLVLAVKAAGTHELLRKLLDAYAAEPDAAEIEVLPCGLCEQEGLLRDGRADVALMHTPFNSLTGFDSEELLAEGQIAVVPAGHPLPRAGLCLWPTSATSPVFRSPAGPGTARTHRVRGPRSATRRSSPSSSPSGAPRPFSPTPPAPGCGPSTPPSR